MADKDFSALETLGEAPQAPAAVAEKAPVAPKPSHGGARAGAGRPAKAPAKSGADTDERAAAKAEEAAREERRKFYDANAAQIQTALGEVYSLPFALTARITDVESVRLTDETIAKRAQTMFWVVRTFAPDWSRYMCVIVLAIAFLYDAGDAVEKVVAEKKRRRAEPDGIPVRPESQRPPTAPPLHVVADPPDAPPRTRGRNTNPAT